MLRAIVVDDEPYICQMISAMIPWEELGIELSAKVSDGMAAWECIERERPDIVITDIRMPGIDGIELIRRSRELYQETPVHFVVISGYDCFSYAQSAIKYGVSDYILKPINEEELKGVLRKIVEKREALQKEQEDQDKMVEHMNYTAQKLREGWLREILAAPGQRRERVPFEDGTCFPPLAGETFRVLRVILDVRDEGVVTVYRENCIKNVCEKICSAMEALGICIEQASEDTFLLSYRREDCAAAEAALKETLQKIRNELMKMKLCWITVGVGCEVSDAKEIWKSAATAGNALEQRLLLGCNKLIFEKEYREEELQVLENAQLRRIESAAEIFDYDQLEKSIDEIFTDLHRKYPGKASPWYRAAEEFTQAYLRCVRSVYAAEGYQTVLPGSYLYCSCPEQLQAELKKSLKKDVDGIQEKHRVCENAVVKRAREYIYENYMHPLSMEEIAEQVSLNPVYFGTLFKKETGDTVINFLIQYRMEKAKELLKKMDYHISEIAGLVGYDDERHFSKQFKKRVGITPKEYRKIHL